MKKLAINVCALLVITDDTDFSTYRYIRVKFNAMITAEVGNLHIGQSANICFDVMSIDIAQFTDVQDSGENEDMDGFGRGIPKILALRICLI